MVFQCSETKTLDCLHFLNVDLRKPLVLLIFSGFFQRKKSVLCFLFFHIFSVFSVFPAPGNPGKRKNGKIGMGSGWLASFIMRFLIQNLLQKGLPVISGLGFQFNQNLNTEPSRMIFKGINTQTISNDTHITSNENSSRK